MHRYETASDLGARIQNMAVNSTHADAHEYMSGSTSKIVPDASDPPSSVGSMQEGPTSPNHGRQPVKSVSHGVEIQMSTPLKQQGLNPSRLDNLVAAFGEPPKRKRRAKAPTLPHGGLLLSIFYAILLVILGVVFPTKEALQGKWLQDYVTAIYSLYLYGVGFLFLVALEIYLVYQERQKHNNIHLDQSQSPERSRGDASRSNRHDPGFVNYAFENEDRTRTVNAVRPVSVRESRYSSRSEGGLSDSSVCGGFEATLEVGDTKRETTLYIRIVVIVLGLAAMVYDGLLIKQLQEGTALSACGRVLIFWPTIVHIGFLLVQCYFLFKHSEVNSLTNAAVVRLGFVHVMATNVTELVRTFVSETFNRYVYHELHTGARNVSDTGCDFQDHVTYRAAPYLYPCVIQYHFLAAALVYFMFSSLDDSTVYCSANPGRKNYTEVNCQRTHKGLFFGIVIFAATAVSVILVFSYMRMTPEGMIPLLIYQISDIALHGILILGVSIAWIQTAKLSYLVQIDFVFEDGVLLISMSLGILFYVFKLIPTVSTIMEGDHDVHSILSLTGSLLVVATGIYQTSFMVDLSCRYLTLPEEWQIKPGRGCIMFLLLTNLSIWLLKCFQIKTLDLEPSPQDSTYGFLPWQLMVHALVPFLIYYYLFSSACLAKTWQQIYASSADKSGLELSSRHERYSTPAKEFEYVRQRKPVHSSGNHRVDVDSIVSPVSNV